MLADLRTAWRALRRAPGLVAAAVLTIALGVAANAVAFAWFKGIALDPLPHVREASALVHLKTLEIGSGEKNSISYPDYLDWRAQTRTLDRVAVFNMEHFGVRAPDAGATGGATASVWGNYASAGYFTTLGVQPALGSFWHHDEASTPGDAPVVVLSDVLWRREFAADPHAIGRTLWVNGVPCTVIGVTPPGFVGAFVGFGFDLWVPVTMYPRLADWKEKLEARQSQWLFGIARPRPGTTLHQINAELAAIGSRVAAESPEARGRRPVALPFMAGEAQQMLAPLFGVLLAAAVLVQLVVCANVANLLLARATARERETGVRAALGASRAHLVRELAAEGVVLTVAGATLGVAAATGARALFDAALPTLDLPVHLNAGVDWRVLALGAGLAGVTAVLAGVVPALRVTRGARGDTIARTLVQGARGSTRTAGGALRALVVAQLALALVALVGAGLFARSLAALGRVDLGFRDPAQVLVASTDLTLAGRTSNAAGQALVARWLDRVRAIPGVESATVSDFVPLNLSYSNRDTFLPTGYVPRRDENTLFLQNAVSDEYFRTLRLPVLRGRAIDARDRANTPPVAMVNETYARRFFAGRDPVGATAHQSDNGSGPAVTIVGVVKDGRYQMQDLAGAPIPFVYVPYAQRASSAVFLQARARPGVDPLALVPAVRAALAAEDPALPLVGPTTLARWSESGSFVQRLGASVMAVLGVVALLLAAVGLYAVTAYTVARRTREIGIRVALGATAARVLADVLGEGGRTAAAGLVVGGLLAFVAARLLATQLYGVSPADPVTFVGAAVVLLAVTLAATWIPARRAAHVNPNEALRTE